MFYPSKRDFLQYAQKGNLIPVYKEILGDLLTPVSVFMKLGKSKYSYLLESGAGSEKVANYSFIGTEPRLIFKSKGRKIQITEQSKTRSFYTDNDPVYEIKRLMSKFKFVPVEGLPRFCGGLVGFIGYDMVRFFEDIPCKNPDDLKLEDSIMVMSDIVVVFDHVEHKVKIVANAYVENITSSQNLGKLYERTVKRIDNFERSLYQPLKGSRLKEDCKKAIKPIRVQSNVTKKDFVKSVNKAKRYVRNGDIIQTVLSQRFQVKINSDPFKIYRVLRSINPSPYMYYLNFDDVKLVGASPEILVRCETEKVEVRPIAGTRARGETEERDVRLSKELLADPKERAEHIMLVDLGRNDIGRVCSYGTVKVPDLMVIERYSHVMHIVSDCVGRLAKGKDMFDVIRATFPAGTVTGAPKIRAMEIIDELENVCRGPYAGAVCYFSFSGNLDSCIIIRTIVIKGDTAYVQAGAGIVADSKGSREYQETINKAKAMIKAIEIAQGGNSKVGILDT